MPFGDGQMNERRYLRREHRTRGSVRRRSGQALDGEPVHERVGLRPGGAEGMEPLGLLRREHNCPTGLRHGRRVGARDDRRRAARARKQSCCQTERPACLITLRWC